MKYPSVKTLAELFGENAKLARSILVGEHKPIGDYERFPYTVDWYRRYYHKPKDFEIKLEALSELGGFYGVEEIFDANGRLQFRYLNAGDTYAATLIRTARSYHIGTFGDKVEALERRGIRFN